MSNAYEKPFGAEKPAPLAPTRAADSDRSEFVSPSERLERLKRAMFSNASLRASNANEPGDEAADEPSSGRDRDRGARKLWLPTIALIVLGGLLALAFALGRVTSDTRKASVEAQPQIPTTVVEYAEKTPSPAPSAATLVLNPITPRRPGEQAPLGVSVQEARDGGLIVVSKLASGATLSAGGQVDDDNWMLSFADLDNLTVVPPPNFIGTMDIVVELRRADATLADKRTRHIEWVDDVAPEPKAVDPKSTQTNSVDVLAALRPWQKATPQRDSAEKRPVKVSSDGSVTPDQEASSKPQNNDEAKSDGPPNKAIRYQYQAKCFVKIDGRVLFEGACPIRWSKDKSVTFALNQNPITITHDHGQIWMMSAGKGGLRKVFKRNSCWGSTQVYVCAREK